MTNLICPLCKSLIKQSDQYKNCYVNCQMLNCHVQCIRSDTKGIRVQSERKSVIKINPLKEDKK